jgi:hypothetical protein
MSDTKIIKGDRNYLHGISPISRLKSRLGKAYLNRHRLVLHYLLFANAPEVVTHNYLTSRFYSDTAHGLEAARPTREDLVAFQQDISHATLHRWGDVVRATQAYMGSVDDPVSKGPRGIFRAMLEHYPQAYSYDPGDSRASERYEGMNDLGSRFCRFLNYQFMLVNAQASALMMQSLCEADPAVRALKNNPVAQLRHMNKEYPWLFDINATRANREVVRPVPAADPCLQPRG